MQDPPFTITNKLYKNTLWFLRNIYLTIYKNIFHFFSLIFKIKTSQKIDKDKVRQIIIIRNDRLGDLLLSLPALNTIRKGFPKATITLFIKQEYAKFISETKLVDRIICYKGTWNLVKYLKRNHFDLSIVFHPPNFLLYLILYLSKIGYRAGYNLYNNGFLLSHPVEFRYLPGYPPLNIKEIFMDIPRGFNLNPVFEITSRIFKCHFPDKSNVDMFFNKNHLDDGGVVIGICSGAGRKSKFIDRIAGYISFEKHVWPKEKYIQLSKWLIDTYNAKIIFIGSKKEKLYIGKIINELSCKNAYDFSGTSLCELYHLINKVDLLITNDTGPMHIAELLKKPMVAIFGYSDPKIWGPKDNDFPYRIVQRKDLPCIPCQRMQSKRDYMCDNPVCMTHLKQEDVKKATKEIIEKIEKGMK